jgi:hypothetical protein
VERAALLGERCGQWAQEAIDRRGPEALEASEVRGVFSGACFDQHFIHPDPWGAKKMCPKQAPQQSALNFLSFFELFATTPQPEPNSSSFAKPLPCEVGLFSRIYIKI